MKFAVAAIFAGLTIAPLAIGQNLELKFDAIAGKASGRNEVDLDGPLLKMALGKALRTEDGKEAKGLSLPALAAGVKGIYIRNYEFEKAGAYSDKEL